MQIRYMHVKSIKSTLFIEPTSLAIPMIQASQADIAEANPGKSGKVYVEYPSRLAL